MKNHAYFVRPAIFVVALLCAILAGGAAFAADETAAVDAVRRDFNAAFNANDAGAIGRLFDAEGMLLPPGMPAVVGAEKVTARYVGHFAKTRSQFELKPGDSRIWLNRALWKPPSDASSTTPRADAPPPFATFLEQVKQARQDGYAVDADNFVSGITTVSAAVRDGAGQPVLAISAVDLSARLDAAAAQRLGVALAAVAQEVSRALGARPAGAAVLPAA